MYHIIYSRKENSVILPAILPLHYSCKNGCFVIKRIYFVTPFAHDHNMVVRNISTTLVFIEQKPFQWTFRRGEGYFVETLLHRQNERTGFIGSSKSPNDGAIRSEICLITWSSCLTSDWFDLDWISGLWLDLDHFDCAGNQISLHWQCQYSEKKKLG